DAAEASDRRGDQVVDGVVAIEVARECQDVRARRIANFLGCLLEIARRPATERDLHALLSQDFRTRPSQALAGAPDHGHLVAELEVHGPTLPATLDEHSRGELSCARSKGSRSSTAPTSWPGHSRRTSSPSSAPT